MAIPELIIRMEVQQDQHLLEREVSATTMQVKIKHATLPIEVYFTTTTVKHAPTIISFIQTHGVELESGAVLEYVDTKIIATASEAYLQIIVGPA